MTMRVIRVGQNYLAASPLYGITPDIAYALRLPDAASAFATIAAAQEKAPRQDFTGWTVETLQEA